MPFLFASDITKSFREGRDRVPVLRGISLGLERGEILSLEGPSGSGKTTLLSILGCILTATSGSLSINGERIDPAKPSSLPAIRKRLVGFVFQQFNLFPALSARENVEYALNIRGQTGRRARLQAERMLEEVGLSERSHFLPRDLSGGQKQRVAIARSLVGDIPLILADEPTANLDSQTGKQILMLFRSLAKESNRALLIVTHDPKVRSITDRTLVIRDGLIENRGE
jgi:putative ABC transport system ATP-binding protein